MKRTVLSIALCASAFAAVDAAAVPVPARSVLPQCDTSSLSLREGRFAEVEGFRLERPYLVAEFGPGTVRAIDACGEVVGYAFEGVGAVAVLDAGPERDLGLGDLNLGLPGVIPFEHALLLGTDGWMQTLGAAVPPVQSWDTGAWPAATRVRFQERLDGLRDLESGFQPPGELLRTPDPQFGASLFEFGIERLPRTEDGSRQEVYAPWLSWMGTAFGDGRCDDRFHWFRRGGRSFDERVLSELPDPELVDGGRTPFTRPPSRWPWDLKSVQVQLDVAPTMGVDHDLQAMTVQSWIDVAATPGHRHLSFALDPWLLRSTGPEVGRLAVLSVTDAQGGPLPARLVGDRLFIDLGAPPPPGSVLRVGVATWGELLEPWSEGTIRPLAGWRWYPRSPGTDPHRFTAIVSTPAFWRHSGTGRIVDEVVGRGLRQTTFRESAEVPEGAVILHDRDPVVVPGGEGRPVVRIWPSNTGQLHKARLDKEIHRWLAGLAEILGPYPLGDLEIIEWDAGGFPSSPGITVVSDVAMPPDAALHSRNGSESLLFGLAEQWWVLSPAWSHHEAALWRGLVTASVTQLLMRLDQPGWSRGLVAARRQDLLRTLDASRDTLSRRHLSTWLSGRGPQSYTHTAMRGPLFMQWLFDAIGPVATGASLSALLGKVGFDGADVLGALQDASGQDLRGWFYYWLWRTPALPAFDLWWATSNDTTVLELELRFEGGDVEDAGGLRMPVPVLVEYESGQNAAFWLRVSPGTSHFSIPISAPVRNVRLDPGKRLPAFTRDRPR